MSAKNSSKFKVYFFILLTILGCVLACTSLIPNDYLKLVVVMGSLLVGIYGISKSLGSAVTNDSEEEK